MQWKNGGGHRVSLERPCFFPLFLLWMGPHFVATPTVKWKFRSSPPFFKEKNSSKPCSEKMAVAKPVWWVSGLLTRFEEQLPCRIGPQTHHSRINVQQNKILSYTLSQSFQSTPDWSFVWPVCTEVLFISSHFVTHHTLILTTSYLPCSAKC